MQAVVEICKDATLELLDSMELPEFMIRTKEQNALYACGFNVLAVLKKRDWFTQPRGNVFPASAPFAISCIVDHASHQSRMKRRSSSFRFCVCGHLGVRIHKTTPLS
jgi:hypothetical protein